MIKIRGIHHIGLAPKDPAKAYHFLTEILGLGPAKTELVEEQETTTHIFRMQQDGQEATRLEVLEPTPPENGPIARYLEKRGGGIHHLALHVDDLDAALKELQTKNVKMIDEVTRAGAGATRIAFIHPHATGGLLIELTESSPPSS